jgi:hypothetical protein
MRVTIDTKAKMAKIYIVDHIGRGEAVRTDALVLQRHLVNLDWNSDEQLIGVEIGLSELPPEARMIAEDITSR